MKANQLRGIDRGVRWALLTATCFFLSIVPATAQSPDALQAFSSEASLRKYLDDFKQSRQRLRGSSVGGAELQEIVVTGSQIVSITNNQTDGVDEGGIVKVHGDHLVILRRGRLFTVAINGLELEPVSWVDAFGPGMNPESAWYDEMLIYRDRIVVIGYSYGHGGTDIGLFRIDSRGRLSYEATYQLRSSDYYSSRNYASRLVDGRLIFYTPKPLWGELDDFPALRKWREFSRPHASRADTDDADDDDDPQERFERIVSARNIYRPVRSLTDDDEATLHSVTTCDLRREDVKCEATVVIGPSSRVFYVSKAAVYVWTGNGYRGSAAMFEPGVLYRMPLDGSSPTALQVAGMPVDQFSFLEDGSYLNVLVRSEGGEGMWRAELKSGDVALLRVGLERFGDGRRRVRWSDYRSLARAGSEDCTVVNRFVGNHLLYGCGDTWWNNETKSTPVHVVDLKGGASSLSLPHSVDRIEVMAENSVVIGTGEQESLHFSGISLVGTPRLVQKYAIEKASQGELRSHGFFYKPNPSGGGVLGLPIRGPGEPGYRHLVEDSAAIVFLQNRSNEFNELGRLTATPPEYEDDDNCRASCIDWYGNARPIFLNDRIFALLGYEIVEARWRGERLAEKKRMTFSPLINER